MVLRILMRQKKWHLVRALDNILKNGTILDEYDGLLGWGLTPQVLAISFICCSDPLGRLVAFPLGLSNKAIKIYGT